MPLNQTESEKICSTFDLKMSSSSLQLRVVSNKEKETQELSQMLSSMCFREKGPLSVDREEIITVPPTKPVTLLPVNKNLSGWITSSRKYKTTYKKFEKSLEYYENNQSYYLSQFEDEGMSREKIVRELTDLECWFSKIIEPFPKPPPQKSSKEKKNMFMQELEEWFIRESEKCKKVRSYYCDEKVVKLLDREYLNSVQKQLFINYELVKAFFKEKESEYI